MEHMNEEGFAEERKEEIPETIKQMGGLDDEIRIYVEDYVYTYLYQYGRSMGATEKIAALVGRYMEINGELICVVSGAIQGRKTIQSGGVESFCDETWEDIYDQMDTYFVGQELLGWVHIQNGFGSYLMTKDETFHLANFKEKWNLFYVLDVVDHVDTFYVQNQTTKTLRQARGYFVYYDKNEEMQNYMMENPLMKPKIAMEDMEMYPSEEEEEEPAFAPRESIPPAEMERMDAAKKIRAVLQRREVKAKKQKRNRYATMATFSCVLSAISLCLGLSLVNYMGKLRDLEGEITVVQSAYSTMETRLEEKLAEVQTQAVFSVETESFSEILTETESKEKVKEAVGVWHMIASGDSLTRLSEQYYGNGNWVDDIMEVNDLDNPDMIFAGQEIWIP
ncbi:LysM peptidoglycan-binding domain-containing protein [Chakrabartyella piscis]|uniref:LysM peptidoglycan-binding domain-containing protein n=1 Tax=Chakrabartyella piscis TaxID=2918914 RepID=UPI002958366B|nr:LysM peptidoglycan-binding domain-containing protein [Chakrabartyella piscis]